MRQPGSFVGNRFWLERPAGSGGTSVVWRAHDRELDRPVALKLIEGRRQEDLLRFGRETQLLLSLNHPKIVRYVAHGLDSDGAMYLALEWLEGEDLAARLGRVGLTIAESMSVVEQVASALAAAHAQGIVHRDVKPSNIFVVGGDLANLRLLDFGIARMAGSAQTTTGPGSVLGTPGYMAPEQARGASDTDDRADIFALGSVLFECLTGREAFGGAHLMAILTKILVEDPPPVSAINTKVSAAIDVLVQRMLAKDPTQRPHAAELVAYVQSLHAGPQSASWTAPPSVRAPALTDTELRLLCVILARGSSEGSAEPTAVTLLGGPPNESLEAYRASVAPLGARVEQLADGSVVVIFAGRDAREQAMNAARGAISLRAVMPTAPMALATGRGDASAPYPVGQAVESAVGLLARGLGREAVAVDEVTAGLLDARFRLVGRGRSLELWGERPALEAERMLLGRPSPFVGREREIKELIAAYDACKKASAPRVVVVTAPAGTGKSRLRYELLKALWGRGERAHFLLGRGDPVTENSPLGLVVPMLKRLVGMFDGDEPAVRRAKIQARVAKHVPFAAQERVSVFLGELLGADFPDEHNPALKAARQDRQVLGEQIRRAWEELLLAETQQEPMVLVLEDLHWSDPSSIKYVEAAMRLLLTRPLFVLALARPEVSEKFPAMFAGLDVTRMELRELSAEARDTLIREVLGDSVAPPLAARLAAQSGGNAFYLEELMRSAAAGGGGELPATVLAMVQTRIEALPVDARRLLRAASVFGQVFWEGGVRALLGGARRTSFVHGLLDELVERELVTRHESERFQGQGEFSFRHATLRDAAYEMLTAEDRALGHRLAAGWLEAAGERDAAVVADHYLKAGANDAAIGWLARAADQAFEQGDLERGIARAEQGVSCGAQGEALGELRARQGHALYWLGDLKQARQHGVEAMALCAPGSPMWCRAASETATSAIRLGELERALATAEELARWVHRGERSDALLAAAARVAEALFTYQHQEPASRLLWAVESAIDGGEPAPIVIAHVHLARAWSAYNEGRIDVSSACYDPAAVAFESIGDWRSAVLTRANQGSDLRELGAFAEAEARLRWALAEGERMSLAHVVAAASSNLGLVVARLGRLDEGLESASRAAESFRRLSDTRMEGGSLTYMGLIHLWRGDAEASRRDATRATELLVGFGIRPEALAVLALANLALGDAPGALRASSEALEIAVRDAPIEEGEGLVYWAHTQALLAAGQYDAARETLAEGRRLLCDRASKLEDRDRRRRFLEDIWEHALTLSLAQSWLDAPEPSAH